MTEPTNENNNRYGKPLTFKMGEKIPSDIKEKMAELRSSSGKNATLNTAALVDVLEMGLGRQEQILQKLEESQAMGPKAARLHLVSDRSIFAKMRWRVREIGIYGSVLEAAELIEDSPVGLVLKGLGAVAGAKIIYGGVKGLIFGSPEDAVEAALK